MSELALVPTQDTVALPVSVAEAMRQWNEYQELTTKLLNDTDFQAIGNKKFKKKSAWRKYARAFNISDRVTFEYIERDTDGFPLWARIRVEASHPSGRTSEADHECHVKERCCETPCRKARYSDHTCCSATCNGRHGWSHPGDLPATALTRAKNRAISDLIGAGEVSAEEMEADRSNAIEGEYSGGRQGSRQQARQATRPQQHGATQQAPVGAGGEPGPATSEGQGAHVESPAPAATPPLDQFGQFAGATDGRINGIAFINYLGTQDLAARDLKGIVPESRSGGADLVAWCAANPTKTLLDLVEVARAAKEASHA